MCIPTMAASMNAAFMLALGTLILFPGCKGDAFDLADLGELTSLCHAGLLQELDVATCLSKNFAPLGALGATFNVTCSDPPACTQTDPEAVLKQLTAASDVIHDVVKNACYASNGEKSCITKFKEVLSTCDESKLADLVKGVLATEEADDDMSTQALAGLDLIVAAHPLDYVDVMEQLCVETPSGGHCGSELIDVMGKVAGILQQAGVEDTCTDNQCSATCKSVLSVIAHDDFSCCAAELAEQALEWKLTDDISVEWSYFEICGLKAPTKSCSGKTISVLSSKDGDSGRKGNRTLLVVGACIAVGLVAVVAVVVLLARRKKSGTYQLMLTPDEEALVMDSDDDFEL
eukprot:m.152373 g.152373  ORF g.152373 m.152373 type:complete len:346 (+) comp16354_c1_seq2:3073-4110(+)